MTHEDKCKIIQEKDKLIWAAVHSAAQECGYSDLDELYSFARTAALRILDDFDPQRGAKIGTFLYCSLKNKMRTFTKVAHRLDLVEELPEMLALSSPCDFVEAFKSAASVDGQKAIDIALALGDRKTYARATPTRQHMEAELLKRGWERERVISVVKELKGIARNM